MNEKLEELLEQLSKVPPRQKWGGLVLGIIAIVGLYYYFVYTDQARVIENTRYTFNKLNLERSEKENYAQNLALYEAKLNDLKRKLDKAQNLLPDDDEVASLLGNLSNLGERVGLTIDRFEPKKETFENFYAAIPFKTKVRGSYHDIATFIDAISKMDRIVNVRGLEMKNPKVINKKIMVESEFLLTTFRFLKKGEKQSNNRGRKR